MIELLRGKFAIMFHLMIISLSHHNTPVPVNGLSAVDIFKDSARAYRALFTHASMSYQASGRRRTGTVSVRSPCT